MQKIWGYHANAFDEENKKRLSQNLEKCLIKDFKAKPVTMKPS
jgi:hypothetical protein